MLKGRMKVSNVASSFGEQEAEKKGNESRCPQESGAERKATTGFPHGYMCSATQDRNSIRGSGALSRNGTQGCSGSSSIWCEEAVSGTKAPRGSIQRPPRFFPCTARVEQVDATILSTHQSRWIVIVW
jgi:hypothetical protein